MNSQTNIEGLLGKPLWQMTGEEYCQLTHYALSLTLNTGSSSPSPPGQKALGVHALAVELGCSDSTVYSLMRTPREDGSADRGGILRPAIVSRIGRRIVFDVETARRLADDYQSSRK